MKKFVLYAILTMSLGGDLQRCLSQEVPVDTETTLNATAPIEHAPIQSVIYIETKRGFKGTGFLLSSGIVITSAHVICGCELADVSGKTAMNNPVHFSSIVRDEDKDIAALVPTERLA